MKLYVLWKTPNFDGYDYDHDEEVCVCASINEVKTIVTDIIKYQFRGEEEIPEYYWDDNYVIHKKNENPEDDDAWFYYFEEEIEKHIYQIYNGQTSNCIGGYLFESFEEAKKYVNDELLMLDKESYRFIWKEYSVYDKNLLISEYPDIIDDRKALRYFIQEVTI